MEGRTILVGDHTGLIKVLNPELKVLGKSGKGRSIINIIPRSNTFLSVRANGDIEEFDLEGDFKSIVEGKKTILDSLEIDDCILTSYPDGSFNYHSSKSQTGIRECKAIHSYQNNVVFCGNSTPEVWNMNSLSSVWKGYTKIPKEEVKDNKCFIHESLLFVGTAKNEINFFDIRSGKKPKNSIKLNSKGNIYEYPVTSLYYDCNFVYAGDSIGHVYKLSKDLQVIGKTKIKSVGAIQSMCTYDDHLYTCGLDRRLMIYDIKSMKLIHKQYLWQHLNKIIVI